MAEKILAIALFLGSLAAFGYVVWLREHGLSEEDSHE